MPWAASKTPSPPSYKLPLHSLASLFHCFQGLPIAIVGDVMLDAYWFGSTTRISPEAPVPVVHIARTEERLGGAANVALNLKALGCVPMLCAVVGNDLHGQRIASLLTEQDMDATGLLTVEGRPTTVKTRIISQNQHMLRVDAETDAEITADETETLAGLVKARLPHAKALIFEDYDKGAITPSLIQALVQAANAHRLPTIVDPKKRNFLAYENVSLFKPNLKELREGLKIDLAQVNPATLQAAHVSLQDKLHHKATLLTLSEQGVFAADAAGTHHFPAHIRQIADVSGAGDTVVAVATAVLAAGGSLALAAQLANLAGGLVCEEVGVAPIQKARLFEEATQAGLDSI